MLDVITIAVAALTAIVYLVYRAAKPARPGQCRSLGTCSSCPNSVNCQMRTETLDRLVPGDHFSIVDIKDEQTRCQLVRLGIDPGQPLYCDYVLPGGPVIVKRGRQQIAIGRSLAGQIVVEVQFRDES